MTTFNDLPAELVAQVTELLSPETLLSWARVNKYLFEASRPRLRELSQEYEVLDLDDLAVTYTKVMDILQYPRLGELVKEIHGEAWIIPSPDATLWPEIFAEKSDNDAFAALWEKRLDDLDLLESAHKWELENITTEDDFDMFRLKRTIALCFPLFPWLRKISARGEDGQELGLISQLIVQQLDRLYLPGTLSAPAMFSCLQDVRLDCCATFDAIYIPDLLRFLRLPNLKIFHANDVVGDGGENSTTRHLLANMTAPKCRLQELQLLISNVSYYDIKNLFNGISAKHLRTFTLEQASVDTELDDFEYDNPEFRPREVVRVLGNYGCKRLETLNLQTDTDMLQWHLDSNVELAGDDYYSKDSDGNYCLSRASLDAEHNLQNFPCLKSVTINAEMLLNGFGAVTRATAASANNDYGESLISRLPWIESDPREALPIAQLLPPSLEILKLTAVQECQIRILNEKIGELSAKSTVDRAPASFPNLKEIRAGDYVGESSPGQLVWSLEDGYIPFDSVV